MMAVSIEELYKQVFEAHRHASDYRLKLLGTWGAVYAAFAAAFVWTQSAAAPLSWSVTALWMGLTSLFWIADRRHRPAIRRSKDVGIAIESDPEAGISEGRRFFSGLDKGVSHSTAIDVFAVVMLLLLGVVSVYLFVSRGELPKQEGLRSPSRGVVSDAGPASEQLCGPASLAHVRTTLYFGLSRQKGLVSELEWQMFLRDEVSTRFPEGVTVLDAQGQWRHAVGEISHEHTKVLVLVHPDLRSAQEAVQAVIMRYRLAFEQESVLWETARVCAAS